MAKPTLKHWRGPVNLVLGLWLLVSPWVLKYQSEKTLMWSAVIFGTLIAVIAAGALFRVAMWQEWGNVVLGICALIAPWMSENASTAATSSAVITGGAVAVMALWALATDEATEDPRSPAT